MIEKLTAKPGVLALRVQGHVARADIDQCFELLAENFENHPKVGLYVEVVGVTGFDTEALSDDFKRGCALLSLSASLSSARAFSLARDWRSLSRST